MLKIINMNVDKRSKKVKAPYSYKREHNSNDLVKKIVVLVGNATFYVTPLAKGNIHETKL